MSSERSRGSRIVRWVVGLGAVGILLGATGAGFFYVTFVRDLPDLTSVADYEPALTSHVYDRNGQPIGSFFKERRQITPFAEIPEQVIQAFIAAEDASYFEHEGIDFKAILRAAWSNVSGDGGTQGASTITQQTVKTLLLTPEQTYTRKIREAILARRLEQHFTKQEILFLYLNQIYFGHGAYGVGAAARSYFDKEVGELDVGEIALLAGLPKAPSKFSPFRNGERAETRRQYVLRRMREEGFIDAKTFEVASAELPVLVPAPPSADDFTASAYFTEGVRRYLFESLGGERVLTGGLRIETTLDIEAQQAAVSALRKGVEDLDRRQGYRGHVRQVGKGGVEEAITGLVVENGFAETPDPDADDGDGEALEPEALAALVGEKLDASEPLLGVVTSVDRDAKLAHVALAPGVLGVTHLEDVSWARPADPEVRGSELKQIRSVFTVGDVAWFERSGSHPMDADAAEARAKAEEARLANVPEGSEPPPAELHLTLHQKPTAQAALLSLDIDNGEVLAMVGGYDFEQSEFDRVTQARRQPGSAFKPLIFGAALSKRSEPEVDESLEFGPVEPVHPWTPASIVYASAQIYEDKSTGFVWKPKNYSRKFLGPVTLRYALAKSINTAAIQLADEVGVGDIIEYAKHLGIESPLERSLALALGSNEVTLLELTRAYAVFPARGRRVAPTFIRRVLDRDGNVLLENIEIGSDPIIVPPPGDEPETEPVEVAAVVEPHTDGPYEALDEELEPLDADLEPEPEEITDPNQLISEEDAFLMADMLRAVVQEGTGFRLRKLGRPLGGKTGTTNDQADGWFVGFSPGIATGVWVGHDSSQKLGVGETGSRAAAPIWVDFMRVALEGRPIRDFEAPDSIVYTRIDRKTGLLASATSNETLFQAFISGTEPTARAEAQQTTDDAMRNLREEAFSGDDSMRLMQLDTF